MDKNKKLNDKKLVDNLTNFIYIYRTLLKVDYTQSWIVILYKSTVKSIDL